MKKCNPITRLLGLTCFLLLSGFHVDAQISGGPGQPADTAQVKPIPLDTAVIPAWCAPFIECRAIDPVPPDTNGRFVITITCNGGPGQPDSVIRNDTFIVPPGTYGVPLVNEDGTPYPLSKYCTGTVKKRRLTPTPVESTFSRKSNYNASRLTIGSVSPNPFTGQAQVDFYSAEQGVARIAVYNEMGALEKQFELRTDKGNNTFPIDGKDLSAGIHFLRIAVPGGVAVARILRQ